MHGAIWTLAYDIDSAERERYLQWFHDVHIPEKLARPGYIWAAHYEGPPSGLSHCSVAARRGGF